MSQTKQHALSRRYWLITWNNPPEDWKSALRSIGSQWGIGQLEQGAEGTLHIQALLWFRDRLNNKFWAGKPVWSKAIYSDQVDQTIDYVTKEDTRKDGPHHFGKSPNHAKSSDKFKRNKRNWDEALTCCKEGRVKEIEASILIPYVQNCQRIEHLFRESTGTLAPRGVWVVGSPRLGKSSYARKNYPQAFLKSQNKWWDGYTGQKFVILEDLDRFGSCLGHHLKIWLDQYPHDGEIKGGHTPTNYEAFVITSNYWPDQLFDDAIMAEAISLRCKFVHFVAKGEFNVGTDFGVRPQAPEDYFTSFLDN